MASIWYIIEFDWNSALGISALNDPLEGLGLLIIIATLVIVAFLAYKMTKSYRSTNNISTLYWALAYIFLFVAVVTLIFEKLAFSTMGSEALGRILTIAALITSGIALVCFVLFAFQIAYPERIKISGFLISILAVIYVGTLSYSILVGPPLSDVISYEPVFAPLVDIIVYCTLLPIMIIPVVVFFNFSWKIRNESRPNSSRTVWMGIGQGLFVIGYTAEVAPFFPPDLAIIFRIFYLVSAYIMYVCFSMPDWFKKRIAWED